VNNVPLGHYSLVNSVPPHWILSPPTTLLTLLLSVGDACSISWVIKSKWTELNWIYTTLQTSVCCACTKGGTLFTGGYIMKNVRGDNIHQWIMSGEILFMGGHYSLRHRHMGNIFHMSWSVHHNYWSDPWITVSLQTPLLISFPLPFPRVVCTEFMKKSSMTTDWL